MKILTKQQIFNKVAKHLTTQNKRCIVKGPYANQCAYLHPDYKKVGNLRCAAGCLLPLNYLKKNVVDSSMNKTEVTNYEIEGIFREHGITDIPFLAQLQSIHDFNKPSTWVGKLRKLARQEGLKLPPCLVKGTNV